MKRGFWSGERMCSKDILAAQDSPALLLSATFEAAWHPCVQQPGCLQPLLQIRSLWACSHNTLWLHQHSASEDLSLKAVMAWSVWAPECCGRRHSSKRRGLWNLWWQVQNRNMALCWLDLCEEGDHHQEHAAVLPWWVQGAVLWREELSAVDLSCARRMSRFSSSNQAGMSLLQVLSVIGVYFWYSVKGTGGKHSKEPLVSRHRAYCSWYLFWHLAAAGKILDFTLLWCSTGKVVGSEKCYWASGWMLFSSFLPSHSCLLLPWLNGWSHDYIRHCSWLFTK